MHCTLSEGRGDARGGALGGLVVVVVVVKPLTNDPSRTNRRATQGPWRTRLANHVQASFPQALEILAEMVTQQVSDSSLTTRKAAWPRSPASGCRPQGYGSLGGDCLHAHGGSNHI